MRYRQLTATGDYKFGNGIADFLIDSPACVGQAVLTRMRLWQTEWFLDVNAGTPWLSSVLGRGTIPLYDIVIRRRILDTPGVTGIVDYASNLDRTTRTLSVTLTINTLFGQTTISSVLQVR